MRIHDLADISQEPAQPTTAPVQEPEQRYFNGSIIVKTAGGNPAAGVFVGLHHFPDHRYEPVPDPKNPSSTLLTQMTDANGVAKFTNVKSPVREQGLYYKVTTSGEPVWTRAFPANQVVEVALPKADLFSMLPKGPKVETELSTLCFFAGGAFLVLGLATSWFCLKK